jgi:hypothetical protein
LGFEISPIKTRSARKKKVETVQFSVESHLPIICENGALRGMKALAREIMIFLSLNIRGVGGILKSASLRRLLRRNSPDIIFLQETLVEEKKARAFMNSFRPSWLSCVVSSVGSSGGLLVSWDPKKFDIMSFFVLWWNPPNRYLSGAKKCQLLC